MNNSFYEKFNFILLSDMFVSHFYDYNIKGNKEIKFMWHFFFKENVDEYKLKINSKSFTF